MTPTSRFKKRETLEIIVDTCSTGKPQLAGIDKLITYVMTAEPRVFTDYKIIVPIQIATEIRQRIYPDFLRAELASGRQSHLEAFYKKHAGHFAIVETDISNAYKFMFAKLAVRHLHAHPELARAILAHADMLAERYTPVLGAQPKFTQAQLDAFMAKLGHAAAQQEQSYATSRDVVDKAISDEVQVTKDSSTHLIERRNLARHGERLFKTCDRTEEFLLQSMYSLPALYKKVSADPDFKRFRRNKGERAIENFLYTNRSETDARNVSVVVSDDARARNSIQHMRSQSHNTIFVVSSWGLALALKQLKLISTLDEVVDVSVIQRVGERKQDMVRSRAESFSKPATMDHILDPTIERQWAHRLAQVLRFGKWESRTYATQSALGFR